MLFRTIPAGDIDIADGDLVMLTGKDYVRQKLTSRFKYFLAEWFLDRREGVPYFRDVFVKNPDIRVIRSVFRQVALSIKGSDDKPLIASLPTFNVDYTPATRSLAFTFEAVLDSGEVLSVPSTAPFIVTVKR